MWMEWRDSEEIEETGLGEGRGKKDSVSCLGHNWVMVASFTKIKNITRNFHGCGLRVKNTVLDLLDLTGLWVI